MHLANFWYTLKRSTSFKYIFYLWNAWQNQWQSEGFHTTVYPKPAKTNQNLSVCRCWTVILVSRGIGWPIFMFTVTVDEWYLSGLEKRFLDPFSRWKYVLCSTPRSIPVFSVLLSVSPNHNRLPYIAIISLKHFEYYLNTLSNINLHSQLRTWKNSPREKQKSHHVHQKDASQTILRLVVGLCLGFFVDMGKLR